MSGTRWMGVFDSHGDEADPEAIAAALAFAEDWSPSIRIAGGDHCLAPLVRSRWGGGAAKV